MRSTNHLRQFRKRHQSELFSYTVENQSNNSRDDLSLRTAYLLGKKEYVTHEGKYISLMNNPKIAKQLVEFDKQVQDAKATGTFTPEVETAYKKAICEYIHHVDIAMGPQLCSACIAILTMEGIVSYGYQNGSCDAFEFLALAAVSAPGYYLLLRNLKRRMNLDRGGSPAIRQQLEQIALQEPDDMEQD